MRQSVGHIHRYALIALLAQPFAIASVRLASWAGEPWRTFLYWLGFGGIASCVVLLAIGSYETRWWNRRLDPQDRPKRTSRDWCRAFLRVDSLSDPFDPIFNQLMRSLGGVIFVASGILSVVGLMWWWTSDPSYTPPSAVWTALIVLVLLNLPAVGLCIYLQIRFDRKLPPVNGPYLPICRHCGYDCRQTPERCPECGHSRV